MIEDCKTIKTLSILLSLFAILLPMAASADNLTGEITPQRRKNFLESLHKSLVEQCVSSTISKFEKKGTSLQPNVVSRIKTICSCAGDYYQQNMTDSEIDTAARLAVNGQPPISQELNELFAAAVKTCVK